MADLLGRQIHLIAIHFICSPRPPDGNDGASVAAVLKTVVGGNVYRGFESHSLRQIERKLGN